MSGFEGGGAYNFVENVKAAVDPFQEGPKAEGGRFAETTGALGRQNPELGRQVAEAQRNPENGHPGVEGGQGGPEHLRAPQNPGSELERSAANVAERAQERQDLEAQLEGLDPITESPSATAESRAETRSTATA